MSGIDRLAGVDQQVQAKHHPFARAKVGPFLCATCEHWGSTNDTCDSDKLIADVSAGLVPELRLIGAVLHHTYAGDCCDYHEKGPRA